MKLLRRRVSDDQLIGSMKFFQRWRLIVGVICLLAIPLLTLLAGRNAARAEKAFRVLEDQMLSSDTQNCDAIRTELRLRTAMAYAKGTYAGRVAGQLRGSIVLSALVGGWLLLGGRGTDVLIAKYDARRLETTGEP